jgi:RimJ/RimL family protein N-acetyltransferase
MNGVLEYRKEPADWASWSGSEAEEERRSKMTHLSTKSLKLVFRTREEMRAEVAQMPPEVRAQVSAEWLTLLERSNAMDPWIHGFVMMRRETGEGVGQCGFKGPPEADGVVEIAYAVALEHQGRGYATEAAEALVGYAFSHDHVRLIRAHTLPEANASTRVLAKNGFLRVGDIVDPDDGLVWRWERREAVPA